MRREPIEVRKATLASILRKSRLGVRLNEHMEHPDGMAVFQHACQMGLEGIVSNRLLKNWGKGRRVCLRRRIGIFGVWQLALGQA
jgi:bifunctional non-homologous end joining protein LigD